MAAIGADHVKLTGSAQRGCNTLLGTLACGEATVLNRYWRSTKSLCGIGNAGRGAAMRITKRYAPSVASSGAPSLEMTCQLPSSEVGCRLVGTNCSVAWLLSAATSARKSWAL